LPSESNALQVCPTKFLYQVTMNTSELQLGSNSLREKIQADMKDAMRAREAARLSAIRLLMAAIKQKEVDERVLLDDAAVLALVDKLLKQRRDSLGQFEAAGRMDLADKERAEIAVLSGYLPSQMGDEEIRPLVRGAIDAVSGQAVGGQLMGKVMALLKPQLAGKADMSRVSAIVKEILSA